MKSTICFLLVLASVAFFACKKKTAPEPTPEPEPSGPAYTVPTTYTFSPMTYTGQTMRMEMLDEMVTYMKTGRTPNTVLSATTLKNMFSNTGNPFTNPALNASGKKLEDKFFVLDVNLVKSYMDSIASASTNSLNIITGSVDATKKYLLNPYNGFDYTEMIEKLVMGATFYYQAMESYICAAGVGGSVDNTTSAPGEGTAMQHHWDEGFGYLGVPQAFPTSTTGVIFWGEYLNEIGTTLGNKSTVMNAFLLGRAAINNKDYPTRDAQITIINREWEKLIAASAIHELNEAKLEITDNAVRNHVLSEARGFIMALKYKTNKMVTQSQIDGWLNTLGNNNNTVIISNINLVIDDIANVYGMQSIKSIL